MSSAAEVGRTLTKAEEACLLRAHQGLTYKETAQELNCLPSTVDTHLKRARQKLGSSSTRAAARAYFGPSPIPRSSGPEPFGSDEPPSTEPPQVHQPSPTPFESTPALVVEQEVEPALEPGDTYDLTAWEKTKRIAAIAVGAALAAGAALPGTLLLLHALQTLHGSR